MRILTSTLAAGALLASSTALHAGGLSPEIMEAPVVMEEPMMEDAGGSLSPTIIVVGVLAALLLAASLQEEEEEDPGIEVSDIRLKTDITQIGTAENGLPIYSYSYIGSDAVFSGVMAQDVLMHTPEAVVTMPGGFYAVDYGMLGLTMERLN